MKRTALISAAAVAFGLAVAPAYAQNSNSQFHGRWNCQSTYTELDQYGNRKSGFVRYYQIQVNANQTYQVQGYTPGVYGNEPFQSQGQWQVDGQGFFIARGPEQSAGGFPGMEFIMGASFQNGELTQRYEMQDPTGSWIMNRSLMQCGRA